MTDDETLYRFLTTKLKEAGLPIESLPTILDISRSTLYRNMKGTVRMSPDVQARFASLLNLDAADRQTFDRLADLVTVDPTLVEARHILDGFVFGEPATTQAPENQRFAVYDTDTFLRTSAQMYTRIIELATSDGATTTVRIINCTTEVPFRSVISFVDDLLAQTNATIEHLLTLPNNDFAAMVSVITRLIPLLRFNHYTVHYAEAPILDPHQDAVFANSVSVEIEHGKETTLFLLSFLKNDLSSCLVTTNHHVIDFFRHNYDAAKSCYEEALVDFADVGFYTDTLASLEEGRKVALIKPNFCYDRIPLGVYDSMIARTSAEQIADAQTKLAGTDSDPMIIIELMLGTVERRVASSQTNRHIDVCSVHGLTELAQTGRISDHMDFIPSFSADERRAILTSVQTRLNDPDDPYTLYVTREEIFANGYLAMAIEDVGVLFEYDQDEARRGIFTNLFIANRALTEVFMDYATNHIPQTRAMSPEDTNTFLTNLIESIA